MLANLDRLRALSPAGLRTLKEVLVHRGFVLEKVGPFSTALAQFPASIRKPAHARGLRKAGTPAATLAALFFARYVVSVDAARAALGPSFDSVREALLVESGEGLRSAFVVSLFNELIIVSDALTSTDAELAMGMTETTVALAQAAFGGSPPSSALDLGCGAGTLALALARESGRVVATDIVPRAIELTELNARLNGLTVDARLGSLFEPVRGERFDLVVSQPPYISRPRDDDAVTFMHAGARGDELALSVLRAVSEHLTPSGIAVIQTEWPRLPGEGSVLERVRSALGAPDRDLLLLAAPTLSAAEQATVFAAAAFPELGAAFEREVETRLDHYEREGIADFVPTLVVVGPSAGDGVVADSVTVSVGSFKYLPPTGTPIRQMLTARRIARREKIDDLCLRTPAGVRLVESQAGVGSEVPSKIQAFLPATALLPPVTLTPVELAVLTAVHESESVAQAMTALAEDYEMDPEEIGAMALVRRLVVSGLLIAAASA